MSIEHPAPTRRERHRQQTVDEIKTEAVRILSEGSLDDVTLSAVARAMGMSVAGLYRYFASREELLTMLAADSYHSLADALEQALASSRPGSARRAIARAYRSWALDQPGRYRLALASRWGSGQVRPETTLPDAHRAMAVMISAFQRDDDSVPGVPTRLSRQLVRWARRTGQADTTPDVLHAAVAFWSSLHGLVALEIEGAWESMQLDAALLLDTNPALTAPGGTGVLGR